MSRPQSLITPLVDECDVFIGVLWTRFGTPPGLTSEGQHFESGTEEEFNRALKRWIENGANETAAPRIMMYFSKRKPKLDAIDLEQMSRVQQFKSKFGPSGKHPGLVYEYQAINEFEAALYQHLLTYAFSLSGGSSRSLIISDFVTLGTDDWEELFSRSQFAYLLVMYSRTWRNTYLQHLRYLLDRGGQLRIILPDPDTSNVSLQLMASRISEPAAELSARIVEAKRDFAGLDEDKTGIVQVRYTRLYFNHALYLFERGGIIALYAYRPDRVQSPAVRVIAPGPVYSWCLSDFSAIFDSASVAE